MYKSYLQVTWYLQIETIARDYGLIVITREGSNPEKYVYDHDVLHKFRSNIHLVVERVPNDISSTRIRRLVRRNESIRFLVPDLTIQYISKVSIIFLLGSTQKISWIRGGGFVFV